MTRAQAFLHITHCAKRMERGKLHTDPLFQVPSLYIWSAGQTEQKEITEFLSQIVRLKTIEFSAQSITFDAGMRACLAAVTRREFIDEDAVRAIVDEL